MGGESSTQMSILQKTRKLHTRISLQSLMAGNIACGKILSQLQFLAMLHEQKGGKGDGRGIKFLASRRLEPKTGAPRNFAFVRHFNALKNRDSITGNCHIASVSSRITITS